MSKIYIHVPAVDEEIIGECKYCGTRFNCVTIDIDEAWHDWSHKWIACDGEIVKPFSEYLRERIGK